MRLRSFTADSMPAAMALIKAELGEDALILSVEETGEGTHITAAIDPDAEFGDMPAPAKPAAPREPAAHINPHATDQLRYDVQHCLRFHNLPELFVSKLVAVLSDAELSTILGKGRMNIANESRHFLKLALEQVGERSFTYAPLGHAAKLMLIGAPGIGKTLAVAKLATRNTLAGGKTVVITTDVNRAGGVEQLKSFTDILGISLTVCSDKKALAGALKLVPQDAMLLIDTAGCNPYLEDDIKHTATLAKLPGITPVLVMPAGIDAQEAIDTSEAFSDLPIAALGITRTDCARRFGGILAVATGQKLPFLFASDSSSVADHVTAMNAKTLAQYLLKP